MKKVFLTGASSGIGLAIAQSLSGRGDEVWGTSREPGRLPQLPHIHSVQPDLLDPNSIAQAFNSAISEAGHFDVVINNAGSRHFGAAEHLSDGEIEGQFQIVVFGHLQLMRLAIAAMRARARVDHQCHLISLTVTDSVHGRLQRSQSRHRSLHHVDSARTARFESAGRRPSIGGHFDGLQ